MARFYVKRNILNFGHIIYVYNDRHHVIFTIKWDKPLRKREVEYVLYNNDEQAMATFTEEITKEGIFLHIEIDGQRYASIRTNKGLSTKGFTVEPQGMETVHNSSKLSFTLLEGEDTIGKIHTKLLRLRNTYAIDYMADDEQYFIILIALAIFIDDRNPSFLGSLFKTIDYY